jgi:hypothetical protein
LLALAIPLGCGPRDLPRKSIYGSVSCSGQKASTGALRFTPMEADSPLPSTSAIIADGQYRVEQFGGVPLGKYRVQVNARAATGRKVKNPMDHMVDETVSIGSQQYSGFQSPLIVEVTADSDGRVDIEIP